MRPETGGILFTDDQLINEELNTEFRTFSNEYDVYNPLITNDAIINRKLSRIFSVNAGVDIDFLKDFTFRTAGVIIGPKSKQLISMMVVRPMLNSKADLMAVLIIRNDMLINGLIH